MQTKKTIKEGAPKVSKRKTKVEESIHEESEKINSVKKIVLERSSSVEDTKTTPEQLSSAEWKELNFSSPNNTIRLGTVFSGIEKKRYLKCM